MTGFIRELQKSVDPNHVTPLQIQYCCLDYYLLREYFTKYGDNLKINENMDKITPTHFIYNSAYGNILIDPENKYIEEYKWDFKVSGNCAYIGIDSSDKQHTNNRFTDQLINDCDFYGYCLDCFFEWQSDKEFKMLSYGYPIKGDTVSMMVNVKNGTMKYYRDGDNLGKVETKIPLSKKYHLAVSIYTLGDFVQIIDFQTK